MTANLLRHDVEQGLNPVGTAQFKHLTGSLSLSLSCPAYYEAIELRKACRTCLYNGLFSPTVPAPGKKNRETGIAMKPITFSKSLSMLAATAVLIWAAVPACTANEPSDDLRPNILLIVADDLGYADLGVHGSDIRTPNIDALAGEGILFTRFHTAPMCAPTRAMLLSGNNNHVAGMARQHPGEFLQAYLPGYEGHLSDRIAPLPKLLRDVGYHTYIAGKWHLGTEEENSPLAAGFERSFNLVDGAGNHWDATGFEDRPSIYRENGVLTDYPDGEYSTAVYTDRLISFIEQQKVDGKPFFVFAAYTSPHWPLQVPEAELNRYKGVYDQGYDVQRDKNFKAMKAAGIVSSCSELPPRNDAIPAWETTAVHADDYVTTLSHRGRSFVRKGNWKIVQDERPFDEDNFELYDLGSDPGETANLAADNPDILEAMITLWQTQRSELGIVLPSDL
jgi:arylsulfatase A-like enzyme